MTNDTSIFSFLDPGVAADILRLDGKQWRDVVTQHVATLITPDTSPTEIKRILDELLRLADAADAVSEERRRS